MDAIGRFVADAVLGTDTLWGGDVMCPSGTGRFVADSWFSDELLPAAYHGPAARGPASWANYISPRFIPRLLGPDFPGHFFAQFSNRGAFRLTPVSFYVLPSKAGIHVAPVDHPFITPIGFSRATRFANPALWTTSMTTSTSL